MREGAFTDLGALLHPLMKTVLKHPAVRAQDYFDDDWGEDEELKEAHHQTRAATSTRSSTSRPTSAARTSRGYCWSSSRPTSTRATCAATRRCISPPPSPRTTS